MRFYRALRTPAIAAAVGLGFVAHAAEPGKPESAALADGSSRPIRLERSADGLRLAPESARPALPQPPAARAPAAAPVRHEFERAAAMAPDDFRYGLSAQPAPGSPLKLSAGHPASRTGWQWSGRVGPLRWMSPLDGEGESKLRFGGRVPGQPRMPGMGHFNVGIHYTFE